MFIQFLKGFYFKPDGGAPDGGAPDGGENDDKKKKKSTSEIIKEMQQKHDEELKKLREELENEKADHAKDLRDKLLQGSGNGENKAFADEIREKMRKKYSNYKGD